MDKVKRSWKQLPDKPRRILVFILGMLLILTAPLIGWLPGPGGMIVFLLGIAVLATEFTWAERFRDYLLGLWRELVSHAKKHPYVTAALIFAAVVSLSYGAYAFYTKII